MAKRKLNVEGAKALPELEAGFTEIKNIFKAGAVPRESDYVKLIEYIHYLHKLLGVEGGEGGNHNPALGQGLIATDGVLSVDASSLVGQGLVATDGLLYVDISTYGGVGLVPSGLGLAIDIAGGNGIEVNENFISLHKNSWEYVMAEFHKATHIALNDFLVVFLVRYSSETILAKAFSRGAAKFTEKSSEVAFNEVAPFVVNFFNAAECSLIYEHRGAISGMMNVSMYTASDLNFFKCPIREVYAWV